jgi:hypothetical protein
MTSLSKEYRNALARGRQERQSFAVDLKRDGSDVYLRLRSGEWIAFPTDRASALSNATEADFDEMKLISGGAALAFPSLRVTYYVPALARGVFGPAPQLRPEPVGC